MLKDKFKCLDRETSLLGLGLMRLPTDEEMKVDESYGIDLVRYAIDHGINYLDTAYTYHGGKSEEIIGKALKDGYRDKVILADKMPIWLVKEDGDLDKYFDIQMQRLGFDGEEGGCIDMYLVHNITPENWEKTKEFKAIEYLETKKAEGKIGHIGFSFHGDLPLFKEVIDAYDWEFCQIQLNYLDKNEQAGLKGLEYARQKGIDVIIMEPLKGGRITDNIPAPVQEIWDDAKASGIIEEARTPAKTAFKWVTAQPGVTIVLSGMGNEKQLDENIAVFSDESISVIGEEEQKVIDRVAEMYNSLFRYQCTSCKYCMPCEKKIDIPNLIELLNNWYAFGKNSNVKFEYVNWTPEGQHGSDCIECGKCEEKCPQGLPIRKIMKEMAEEFGL